MILFFNTTENHVLAVLFKAAPSPDQIAALEWLFDGAKLSDKSTIKGPFTGPRREMITPFSTTAVEITQNMNLTGIERIEEFKPATPENEASFDRMLQAHFPELSQDMFTIGHNPEPIMEIDDIKSYNTQEGLALSNEEIDYLKGLSVKLGRKLTDSEIFGFSQVNSEHCRHKIFNGTFVIDGETKPSSLFGLIKKTSA